jgi:very-short-patch-repair endonuclease
MSQNQTSPTFFDRLLAGVGVPAPLTEYQFDEHDNRKWRFDYAWPDEKMAVELEGSVFRQGRHTRGRGYMADCEKYNAATIQGWTVLRYTTTHLDEQPVQVVEQIAELHRLKNE